MRDAEQEKKILIHKNGSLEVQGNIPLVKKIQVVSEFGEPITWKKEGEIKTDEPYYLCRCGRSSEKPFCDEAHKISGFDGTETASTDLTETRQGSFPGGTGIVVKKDFSLCMSSGFCGTRDKGLDELVQETTDTSIRSQVMAMIDHCPSGSLIYSIEEGEEPIEPDLPKQVAVTTEVTSDGAIPGPLWVTGGIPVERSDGKPCETRNRVTLCNCGESTNKPFCDGSHRITGRLELRKKKAEST